MDIKNKQTTTKTRLKKKEKDTVTHSESDMSAMSLLEGREWRYIKAINNNNNDNDNNYYILVRLSFKTQTFFTLCVSTHGCCASVPFVKAGSTVTITKGKSKTVTFVSLDPPSS